MNVALVKCDTYEDGRVVAAVEEAIAICGGMVIKSGDRIVLKVNLVGGHKPDEAVTTHPAVVAAVARHVLAHGGVPIIADSPGSVYSASKLNSIYKITGMSEAARLSGAALNDDFSSQEVSYPNGYALKRFDIINVLYECDGIINLCKYKTHTFTGFSAAIKNMFGAIPGLKKVEMHGSHTDLEKFCDLLIDIQEYFKPKLLMHITDGIIGMEGEGPTGGDPKAIGMIMASKCCYSNDVIALNITKNDYKIMPMIYRAIDRGLLKVDDITVLGASVESLMVDSYNNTTPNTNRILNRMPRWLFNMCASKPLIKKALCKGCGKCFEHCPPKAITMENGMAIIDYEKCIRCYCCQELCPFHIVRIKRPVVSKILNKFSGVKKLKKK